MSAAVTNESAKTIGKALAAELKEEAATTRKIIERLPNDKFDWKPHEKSMSLSQLASHIIEMVGWTTPTMTLDGLDFATMDYKPTIHENTASMLETFDKNVAESISVLSNASDEEFAKSWYMRKGETLFFELPRAAVLRSMVFSHIIHHRGQLSVYIRMLGVPVPMIYGPSGDEGSF
jgi:uncharacterized damage-inducible protein DinB